MRNALIWMAVVVCFGLLFTGSSAPVQPKARHISSRDQASVVSTVELPNGDGRVHVLTVPGQYDASKCLVLITTSGGTLLCIPQADAELPNEP